VSDLISLIDALDTQAAHVRGPVILEDEE